MTRAGTIDLSTTDPEAVVAIDALMRELEMAQISLRSAEADFEDAAQREREAVENARKLEREVRDKLFAAMEEHGVPTVKDGSNTAVVVQRHDYAIEDEDLLWEKAFTNPEEWRIWDMAKIKKFASEYRKANNGSDLPGIASVPKRYLQVTQKTSEG